MSSSAFRPTGRPGANARTTSTTATSTPCSAFPRNRATQWREQLQRLQGGRSPASRHWKQSARRNCSSIAGSGRKPTARALEDNLRQQRERLATSEQAYLDTYSQLQADNQRREQSQALLAELERARAEFRRWGPPERTDRFVQRRQVPPHRPGLQPRPAGAAQQRAVAPVGAALPPAARRQQPGPAGGGHRDGRRTALGVFALRRRDLP